VLAAVSLSLGLSCLLSGPEEFGKVLESNQWDPSGRMFALLSLGVTGLLALLLSSLGAVFLGGQRLLGWARRSTALVPLGLLPVVLQSEFWFRHPLEYLLLLATFGFASEACFRVFFDECGPVLRALSLPRPLKALKGSKRAPFLVVCVASLGYIVTSSYLTIMDHYRFGTGAYDLGIFDNLMFNTLKGRFFHSSVMYGEGPGNSIAGHAEFGMLLFAPIYALYPGAEMMRCIQATALGGAAVFLYLFASTQITRWSAALISCAYLLYAPMHGAQYYDFHWLCISVPFVFLLFYGLAIQKKRIVIPTTIVLYLIREDIAPGICALGLMLLLTGARPRFGVVLAICSAAWFATVKFVIMPHFGTWFFADLYKDLMVPGEHSYGSAMKTMLSNPVFTFRKLLTEPKLIYVLHILVPLLFLPLRRPIFGLLLLPGCLFTILTNWPAAISIRYHYSSHWTPYMFGALVLVLSLLPRLTTTSAGIVKKDNEAAAQEALVPPFSSRSLARYPAAVLAFVLTLLCHSTVFGLILEPSSFVGGIQPVAYSLTEKEQTRLDDLRSLISKIPPDASVTSTDFEAPHLSNRMDLFAVGQSLAAGEYLLLSPHSYHLARTKQNIASIMDRYPYGFVAKAGGMTLWKRHHVSPETEAETKALNRDIRPRPRLARPSRHTPAN
jgi:uncharacterized membrane protein